MTLGYLEAHSGGIFNKNDDNAEMAQAKVKYFHVFYHGSSHCECCRTANIAAITTLPILYYEDVIYQYEMKS